MIDREARRGPEVSTAPIPPPPRARIQPAPPDDCFRPCCVVAAHDSFGDIAIAKLRTGSDPTAACEFAKAERLGMRRLP
jgi:hypothetical protein